MSKSTRGADRTLFALAPLCAAALLVTGCMAADPDGAASSVTAPIIEGEPPEPAELSTVGVLIMRADATRDGETTEDTPVALCTATLISPTAVLTAGHCVDEDLTRLSAAVSSIGLGDLRYQFSFARSLDEATLGDVPSYDVARVEQHEGFFNSLLGFVQTPGRFNDVAIAYLAAPIRDRRYQRLASTDVFEAVAEADLEHRIAGYGASSNGVGDLLTGLARLGAVGEFEFVTRAEDRQQACHGDSGGPIFGDDSDTFQIGVASRMAGSLAGPRLCDQGVTYVRVDAYLDWITERVPDLPPTSNGGCAVGYAPSSRSEWQCAWLIGLCMGLRTLRRRPRST